jgi:hypothetical protein
MITCQICKSQFKSVIHPSHLKKHGILPVDYKKLFGVNSLSTDEYRKKKSEHFKKTNSKKIPWNKNKKIKLTDAQKQSYILREQKYNSSQLKRREYNSLSEETKSKISNSIKKYSENNKKELAERFKKAQKTKINKGISPVPSFRGKKHSFENIKLFAELFKKYRQKIIEKSHISIIEKIQKSNLELINDISNTQLQLCCKICKTQFSFTKQYFNDCKFHEKLCPVCFPRTFLTSKAQKEVYNLVKELSSDAILNYRTVHGIIDIYIPSKNLGIEYNGLYWHSVEVLSYNNKSKIKDFEKYIKLRSEGIKIICIFEDEWINKKQIVVSKLNNIFGSSIKIGARKCIIKELDILTAKKFFEENHIQGYGNSQVRYGLFYKEELLSAMSFSKVNISRKNLEWEITRFCNRIDVSVVGGASKIFKYFLKQFNPDKVITYADSRWSNGNVYGKLGFSFIRQTVPNYWYFKPNELKRIHRFSMRKKDGEPKNMTEKELRFLDGFYHIYDYGSSKWEWINHNVND